MYSKKIEKALNDQINKELYSAYLYQSMATYLEDLNMKGFAKWMDVQAQEEVKHARKIYEYIFSRGGKVILAGIENPKTKWKNAEEIFSDALEHEQFVTKSINSIYELAKKESDYPTEIFLQWFITEQVEEEETASEILEKIKMFGNDKSAMYFLDKELGGRVD